MFLLLLYYYVCSICRVQAQLNHQIMNAPPASGGDDLSIILSPEYKMPFGVCLITAWYGVDVCVSKNQRIEMAFYCF